MVSPVRAGDYRVELLDETVDRVTRRSNESAHTEGFVCRGPFTGTLLL
jgi:hypothetical protein